MTDQKNDWQLQKTIWSSKEINGESLFFIRDSANTQPACQLLFEPVESLVITSATREISYKENIDYIVEPNSRVITLPEGSNIPFTDRVDLYPGINDEHSIAHKKDDENLGLYFGEGHFYHDLQEEASYQHNSSWPFVIPKSQKDLLPNTIGKLNSSDPLNICLCGDSISAGANASKHTGAKPFMLPYPELFVNELIAKYKSEVEFKNFAVGGKRVKHGLQVLDEIIREKPDLVIIAYGMNDIGSSSAEKYLSTVSQIMAEIQDNLPNTEFILVASMLGNPEWHGKPSQPFFEYRDALKSLQKEGVALADITQIWSDILQLKSYHDLTGNGVNHPNDFGHRIYAQVLGSIFEKN